MESALQFSQTLETITCCSCGVVFAVPQYLKTKLQETHHTFHCPNGHEQHFTGKTEAERLREELKEEQNKRYIETNRRITAESQVKKLQKRAKAGMCPCCKRSFVALSRHIKTKHPEFAEKKK